jgi:gas vesicle protein
MKDILYFILGVTVGALAALMLAPKSGEELRVDIQQRANSDLQKLQKSYEQGMAEVNKKLEQVQVQLKKNQEMGEDLIEELNADDAPAAA